MADKQILQPPRYKSLGLERVTWPLCAVRGLQEAYGKPRGAFLGASWKLPADERSLQPPLYKTFGVERVTWPLCAAWGLQEACGKPA